MPNTWHRAEAKRAQKNERRRLDQKMSSIGRDFSKAIPLGVTEAAAKRIFVQLPPWHGIKNLCLRVWKGEVIAGREAGVYPAGPGEFEQRFEERKVVRTGGAFLGRETWVAAPPIPLKITDWREDSKYDSVTIPDWREDSKYDSVTIPRRRTF